MTNPRKVETSSCTCSQTISFSCCHLPSAIVHSPLLAFFDWPNRGIIRKRVECRRTSFEAFIRSVVRACSTRRIAIHSQTRNTPVIQVLHALRNFEAQISSANGREGRTWHCIVRSCREMVLRCEDRNIKRRKEELTALRSPLYLKTWYIRYRGKLGKGATTSTGWRPQVTSNLGIVMSAELDNRQMQATYNVIWRICLETHK
ncbi:hypothetical protein GGR57DRAFT_452598 [Xylariaceae sp. FL1272]|nr:hypothetical protein GGR57DRAFT_452598 [Xylariaceae sp. FL1272]